MKSFSDNSSPVNGHLPPSAIYFNNILFSNNWPVFLETIGSCGTSPETIINTPINNYHNNKLYSTILEQNIVN